MESIGSILVATDLSAAADSAVIHAARLARDAGATLRVVHVASSETMEMLGSVMPEAKGDSGQHDKERAGAQLKERLGSMGLASEPEHEVRFGKPHREIIAAVEAHGADLLVIGATGQTGRRMGTVSGRCVRMSPVSVLLVPERHAEAFKSVVACVDFSDGSPEVVRQASILAEHEGADLHAAYVYHIPDTSPFHGSGGDLARSFETFPDRMAARFREQIEPAARGASVSLTLVENLDYTQGILGYVERERIDLVVVGTTKRSKLGYAIMGTTAEKVIRDSHGAVLAAR